MKASLDIETACGVEACPGFGLSNSSKCDHALHHKQNQIKIIGVYDGADYYSYREVAQFDDFIRENPQIGFIAHGGKFDYKTLKAKGSCISPKQILGDTQLAASCCRKKVPPLYLKDYNEKRKVLNEELPQGSRHRPGTPLTLKVLAPYYLGVAPFWENPLDHDDPEYNRLDCEYTFHLHEKLMGVLDEDGTRAFYENFLVPWSKLLAEAEFEGVLIDTDALYGMYQQGLIDLMKLETGVHGHVKEAFDAWIKEKVDALEAESRSKCDSYIEKRLKDKSKADGVRTRYADSLNTKINQLPTQFNLNSSEQVKFILNFYGIDTAIEKRDKETNEWVEAEGTDKYVLKRAKVRTQNELAAKFLELRQKQTEVNYIKQYIESTVDGRIHTTFNITGTRTGRLSSSGPNLQNVKGALRKPFVVADPDKYSIYTVDASQIEPRVVAYLTGDEEMVNLFCEGRDYHNYATKKFFPAQTKAVAEDDIKKEFNGLRKTAKIGDLSIIYGTGAQTFQTMCLVREEMDIPLVDCKKMVYTFRSGMQGVFDWKSRLEDQYRQGTPISDYFGFPVEAKDKSSIHMTLFNTFVQGMASRMIFHASLLAFREFCRQRIDAKPLLWIHDEVVWRFPKGQEEHCQKTVDHFMTHYKLETRSGRVPLAVEGHVADRWQK